MVQRKAPNKLVCPTEPKRSHIPSEKRASSHLQHDAKNKAGGDLRKIMKKSRSIKASELESLAASPLTSRMAQLNNPPPSLKPSVIKTSNGSPNYMKPTSSSDARKERLQVTIHSPASNCKSKSPKNSNNSNNSKPPSPSPVNSGVKPAKTLARKSSLRPKRPSMKRSSGMVLYPKKIVNRATCSSTLKDSKFPKVLDLSPGGTESEGTSILKVCPYSCCSLNGHAHESLPPLKRFLSAKRRLLKTQKSMKLKGLSSFRRRSFRKGRKHRGAEKVNVSSNPSELKITPLMEESGNDFLVEIYSKPREVVSCDERKIQDDFSKEIAEILSNLSSMEDDWDWESSELGAEASDMRFQSNQIPEAYSDISFGGDLDQNGEIKEIDGVMSFLNSKELDWQAEAKEENSSYLVSEKYEEWGFECCMVNDVGKRNEGLTESAESILAKDNKTENETDNSEYLCDGFGQILCPLPRNESSDVRFLLEPADPPIASEEGEVAEKFGAAASGGGGALEGNCSDEACNMPDDLINHELNDAFKQHESSTENYLVHALPMSNENTSVSEESSIDQPLCAKNLYVSPILDCNSSEPVDLEGEEDLLTADGSPENSNLNIGITDEKNENEKQCFGNLQRVSETDQDNMEGDDVRSELESKDPKLVDATEDSSVPAEISDSFIFNGQSVESNLRGTQEQEKQQQEENWIDDILQIKDAVRFDVDENGLEASNESPQTDESTDRDID